MLWLALMLALPGLTGVVRDADGLAMASVSVELKSGSDTVTAKTDAEGRYRFASLHAGTYAVHAGQFDGTVTIAGSESKTFDIRMGAFAESAPQFFDPPSFIVAGVTDSSQRGGHGSDPVLHSTQAMAQEMAKDLGSARKLLEQAVSCYSRALYDDAARYFFEATDREPSAIEPYLVLGRARNSPVGRMAGFSERMARFARLHPENAWANYYLGTEDSLQRAVRIDPGFEEAWFELGVVYENQDNRAGAVEAWKKAPARPEAHYRLSRAYRQSGDPAQAQAELELYEKLSRQAAGGPAR